MTTEERINFDNYLDTNFELKVTRGHSDLDFEIRGINSKFFDPGYIFTNPIQG